MSKLSKDVVKNNVDISYHMNIFVTRLVTIIRYKWAHIENQKR